MAIEITTPIRGAFSDTARGRTLRHMAAALGRALDAKNIHRSIEICRNAESLTTDRQWRSVRETLESLR